MVRGLLAVMILPLFQWLRGFESLGYVNGAIVAAIIIMGIAITASLLVKETFGRDLDFTEK